MIEMGVASCLVIDALTKDFFCLRTYLKEGGGEEDAKGGTWSR